jgi:transcriptional regulator with XRE-family HTH domain
MVRNLIPLEEWEAKQMQDPEFVAAMAELEPAYQVARLRIMRGLTQEQLAEMTGTKQPSIARLESGASTPSVSFLRKVAAALGSRLEVRFVPLEQDELI